MPGAVQCPSSAPSTKPGTGKGKATFSGAVVGTPLPSAGAGRAAVLAIRLPGGQVASAGWVSAGGRYSLKVDAGTYALVTWVADLKRAKFTQVASALVRAAPGAKRTLSLSTVLKKKRKLSMSRHTAGFGPPGFPTVPAPAGQTWVVVDPFRPGTGEMEGFGEGMQGMLITDLVQAAQAAAGRNGCDIRVSSLNYRIEDLIGEIKLQETPFIDPATRVARGGWVEPNAEVRGTFSNSDATQTATASVQVFKNGKSVGTATRTVGYGNAFDLPGLLAKDIVNLLCKEKPPIAYTGTLDGTAQLESGPGQTVTFTWKGTMTLSMLGDSPGGPGGAPGTWRIFGVDGGTVHIDISGAQGECSVSGAADDAFGKVGQLMVRIDGDRHDYQPTLEWSGQVVPTTFAGSDACKASVDLPLSEGSWARLDTTAPSDTYTLEGSVDRTIKPGFTEHTHWVFTPRAGG